MCYLGRTFICTPQLAIHVYMIRCRLRIRLTHKTSEMTNFSCATKTSINNNSNPFSIDMRPGSWARMLRTHPGFDASPSKTTHKGHLRGINPCALDCQVPSKNPHGHRECRRTSRGTQTPEAVIYWFSLTPCILTTFYV